MRARAGAAARAAKRALDLSASVVLLAVLSPVIAAAAALVLLEDGPPVFFAQQRSGFAGVRFRVWKFRSMHPHDAPPEAVGQVYEDHELVTRVGRVLRRSKIDELPQLWNVLRGEMSLVGPRPTLTSQVERYDEFQRRRLTVRPGMTGWSQVNGNARLSWEERIEMDVWYVDHWSLGLDLRILLSTLRVVAWGERPNPRALELAAAHAERTGRRG